VAAHKFETRGRREQSTVRRTHKRSGRGTGELHGLLVRTWGEKGGWVVKEESEKERERGLSQLMERGGEEREKNQVLEKKKGKEKWMSLLNSG